MMRNKLLLLLGDWFVALRLSSCLLCGAAGTDYDDCSPCAIYTPLSPNCSQMRVLPPTPSMASGGVLWSKQGKLFLEKNERRWKIQSHQYFTYVITVVKELINEAAEAVRCITHQWECRRHCTLAEPASGAMKAPRA